MSKKEGRNYTMELNDLDRINEAKHIISGVKDNMIMMDNSSVKEVQNSIYYVMENALEKAVTLLDDVAAKNENQFKKEG